LIWIINYIVAGEEDDDILPVEVPVPQTDEGMLMFKSEIVILNKITYG
jgi:hypothetical protein